jgi:hypothetical protein
MSWGAVVGAGIGLAGSMLESDSGGGAGTQTQSKEPWAPLQPWLLTNALQGIEMQGRYQAQPFSPQQQAAYDNSYAQSDYMRDLVPSLLGQMQQQPVGFDPANPLARPKAWDWNAMGGGSGGGLGQRSVLDAKPDPAPAQAAQESPLGQFIQQGDVLSGMNMSGQSASGGLLGSGGYGSFKYGMDVQPGTQAYRDMSEYFAMGGVDPNNIYGKGDQGQALGVYRRTNPRYSHPIFDQWMMGPQGAPGTAEGPSSGAPGGAASAGPGGTF